MRFRVPLVIRFKNPQAGEGAADDVVHGRVVLQNAELDNLIIARSDGSPTYKCCVVVDDSDMDMEIKHVIRGDDHLNNMPRQMNMLTALGAAVPAAKLTQPLSLALCGDAVSAPFDATLASLGRKESLRRLASAAAAWDV